MLPTTPQRPTHDDDRNGTIDLFAALEVPAGLDVHPQDSGRARVAAAAQAVPLPLTSTYGSWMNLVERWFSALTTKKLQGSAQCTVNGLAADLRSWAETWNDNPEPFT